MHLILHPEAEVFSEYDFCVILKIEQNCLGLLLWVMLCFIFLRKTGFCPINDFHMKGLGETRIYSISSAEV